MKKNSLLITSSLIVTLTLLLTGCFGEPTLDSSDTDTIKSSAKEIKDSLPEDKKEKFDKAIIYFSMGGSDGLKNLFKAGMNSQSSDDASDFMRDNLKVINGLTGNQILEKYYTQIKQDEERIAAENRKREAEKAEREKVFALKAQAEELLESKNFQEAIDIYTELSNHSSGVEVAEKGIAETNKAMKLFQEKMAYINNIEIVGFEAKRIDTYLKKNVPAVRFDLKNNGGRSLDAVEVVVYFKDKEGKVIFEENYLPVWVSQYSINDNKPLKGGYVDEMEKNQYYTLKSELKDWDTGNAVIKIVDIEFSEEK